MGLTDCEKFANAFTCFDTMHERNIHPDRKTPHDRISRPYAQHCVAKLNKEGYSRATVLLGS